MGNHRFRWSDMIPNAWFNKLKDMSRASNGASSSAQQKSKRRPINQNQKQVTSSFIPCRASYYFPASTSQFHPNVLDPRLPSDPPRKSTRKAPKKPASPRLISSASSRRNSTSESDSMHGIIPDVGAEPKLPPIITKHVAKKEEEKPNAQQQQQQQRLQRMRAISPRVASRRVRIVQRGGGKQRKSVSESFAVVKSSSDPRKDFKESMMEMIKANNLRAAKDLEELLACYLSLNSNEFHEVIVKVFEELWFDIYC